MTDGEVNWFGKRVWELNVDIVESRGWEEPSRTGSEIEKGRLGFAALAEAS